MRELHLIAHDLRSRENVGALFRTCDSLGVSKLWLSGYTPAPPDEKIAKVALEAERSVPFEQQVDVTAVFEAMERAGIPVFALELTTDAVELSAFAAPDQMALLLGTETTGVPPSLLARCAGAIKITQQGIKESMNVGVAAGIACWAILHRRA